MNDANEVEKALHLAFGMTRINSNREFFKLEPERVIAVLKLLKVDDITAEFEQTIEADLPSADKQSSLAVKRSMRPPMNFHELGMANGSVLIAKDGVKQATVAAEKKVTFEGEVSSLTAATRKLLNLAEDYAIQPSPYWTFNGKTIKEIYENFHNRQAEN